MNILVPDASPAAVAAHPIDTLRAASAVPETLAQKLAAEHYGLIAAVHRLDSERDQNFRPCSTSLPRTLPCRSRVSFRRGTA